MSIQALLSHARDRLKSPDAAGALVRGAGAAFAIQVVGMGLKYLLDLLFARWMGAEPFGTFIYAINWVMLLALPAGLGLSVSVLRFVPGYLEGGDRSLLRGLVRRGRQFTLLSGAVLAALATGVFVLVVPEGMDGTVLRLGMWLVPLWALLALQLAFIQGTRRIALAYAPSEMVRPGAAILLGLVLWLVGGLTPLTALGAFALSVVAALAMQEVGLRRSLGRDILGAPPAFDTRLWVAVSFPLLLGNAALMVLQKADGILLGTLMGPLEAGIYQGAAKTQLLAGSIPIAVNAIAAPTIGRLYAQGDRPALGTMVRTAARWMFWPSLAITVILLVAAGPVLAIWGPEFQAAAGALRILAVGQLVNAVVGPVGWLLSLTGHQKDVARVFGTAALLNVVLNLLLIPVLGLVGAALASAVTMILWNVWMYVLVDRHLGIKSFAFAPTPKGGTP